VDKAKEMGIDWWEHDPSLSSRANGGRELAEENKRLRAEIEALREDAELASPEERRSVTENAPHATPQRRQSAKARPKRRDE
jgi:hypothetical protein